jgi:hypothetical protein
MARLNGSVGAGGRNIPGDVSSIQNLINQSIRLVTPLAFLPVTGICDSRTIDAIVMFQTRVVGLPKPDGRVDPGGKTLTALGVCAGGGTYGPSVPAGPPAPTVTPAGGKYTTDPMEMETKRTTPTARDVVTMLRFAWSDLTENGARTLTAQFMAETGGGKYCFNWNLGNVKARSTAVPHMYLKNVWEIESPAGAASQVSSAGGLAHVATLDEIKSHGWGCPPGKSVVVYQPPHTACRFRAYVTLTDGAQKWVAYHKSCAARYASYLDTVNAGDCAGVARILKQDHYYTASEADYARGMTRKKAEIDRTLGAIT